MPNHRRSRRQHFLYSCMTADGGFWFTDSGNFSGKPGWEVHETVRFALWPQGLASNGHKSTGNEWQREVWRRDACTTTGEGPAARSAQDRT